jgi:ABC-type transport system involved in Fe-S cluster assembly fused permease/ATPase subunit
MTLQTDPGGAGAPLGRARHVDHRAPTAADRIPVIDDGRVIGHGRHHELLAQNGPYAKMWV